MERLGQSESAMFLGSILFPLSPSEEVDDGALVASHVLLNIRIQQMLNIFKSANANLLNRNLHT